MTDTTREAAQVPVETEMDLLAALTVILKHKKMIAASTLGLGGAALVTSLLLTPIYTATSKIMPPQQQSSTLTAMLGQLGSLAGAAGSVAGLKNPNDLYVGMLQSQSVADNLIRRFNLQQRYQTKTMADTRRRLATMTDAVSGKDGLIALSVDDEDPKFAATLANAYVDELSKVNQRLAVTDAAKRRFFFEQQLKETKDKLAEAEVALKKTQEQTGILQPEGQIQVIVANMAQLRAGIASKEVELSAMRSFATAQNPNLQKTEQELQAMRAQLAKLEQNQAAKGADIFVPTGKLPESGMEYVRRLRDMKYYETMFELMAKQYESAKLDESKDSSSIQVLDVATVPDQKSRPKRALLTIAGFFVGLCLGLLAAFSRESYLNSRRDDSDGRWDAVFRAWSGKA
ncbi:Wzz/FepE/Etk N-terminal domain-containing protein [Aquitalea sp. ASV15]|uniref:GumC family protein n=1 Tax=Aquitalea sp. ASV15 TaxID=2795104 RepID=UPI0018EC8CF7|nr:Wzz/FepE/Etk N-terminal domain-containing protein [Aquitalea sp. ASV15]